MAEPHEIPTPTQHARLKTGRRWLFDLAGLLVVSLMGYFLFNLIMEFGTGFGELDVELTQEDLEAGFREGFEYHSLYLGADKVGTLRTERRYNGDGYHIKTIMEITLPSGPMTGGKTRNVLDAYLDPEFRLESFALEINGIISADIEGQWNGEAMVVTGLPGESGARSFELPEAPFIMPSLRPVLMRRNLAEGDRVSFTYYDPLSQQPITTDVKYMGEEEIELMGKRLDAYRFQQSALGHRTDVWVNALGEVLIEEMPMGFRAVREPEAEAKFGLLEPADIDETQPRGIDLSGVSEASLGRWRWSTATIVLDELRVNQDIADSRQSAVDDSGRVTIEIQADDALPEIARLSERQKDERREHLGGELGIDTNSQIVREVVRYVLGQAPMRVDLRVEKLTVWVADEIDLLPYDANKVETAASVIEAGAGTTRGKALALAALLRVAGVPSRVAHGAVVVGEELVWHDWVEAWVGRWIPVDPTFKQIPAGAGHLRLGYGGQVEQALVRTALRRVQVIEVSGE